MMQLRFDSNHSSFLRGLGAAQRSIRTAAKEALDDTAFQVRNEIVHRTYPQSFTVRSPKFASNAFRVYKASPKYLNAVIFDKTESEWLSRQAHGGVKTDPRGLVPVPTKKVKRNQRGISKRHWQRSILARGGFKVTARGGENLFGKAGKSVSAYYFLRRRVNVPKRFPFYETGERIVRQTYTRNFSRRFLNIKS